MLIHQSYTYITIYINLKGILLLPLLNFLDQQIIIKMSVAATIVLYQSLSSSKLVQYVCVCMCVCVCVCGSSKIKSETTDKRKQKRHRKLIEFGKS